MRTMLGYIYFEYMETWLFAQQMIDALAWGGGGGSNSPDEITTEMLMLCGNTAIIPITNVFENILSTVIFTWKQSNVLPIIPQETEQTLENYIGQNITKKSG